MCEIKVAPSGLTFAAPLRVLLGKESCDQDGLPFANCALYAVMQTAKDCLDNCEHGGGYVPYIEDEEYEANLRL